MKGGAGNDFFEAGEGHDTFIGGTGTDLVSYAKSKLAIGVELLAGVGAGGAQFDTWNGVENIDGSAFNDQIDGDNASNQLRGLAGNDHLKGLGGNDTIEGATAATRSRAGAARMR